MSHQHTLSTGPCLPVHRDGFLPASLADEYRAGATLKELAARHKSSIGRVRDELILAGVKMRRKGPKDIAGLGRRLREITTLREEGMRPGQICARYGISRQRVCQLLDPGYNARRYAEKKAKGTR